VHLLDKDILALFHVELLNRVLFQQRCEEEEKFLLSSGVVPEDNRPLRSEKFIGELSMDSSRLRGISESAITNSSHPSQTISNVRSARFQVQSEQKAGV
jgi:hypothetical protein